LTHTVLLNFRLIDKDKFSGVTRSWAWATKSEFRVQLARVRIPVGAKKFSDGTCKYLPCVELLLC